RRVGNRLRHGIGDQRVEGAGGWCVAIDRLEVRGPAAIEQHFSCAAAATKNIRTPRRAAAEERELRGARWVLESEFPLKRGDVARLTRIASHDPSVAARFEQTVFHQ